MTVYTGRTFQTCALRVWGIWVSMRDFHAATVRSDEARENQAALSFIKKSKWEGRARCER
jgi:hypothetical protein